MAKRILYVEDDRDTRDLVALLLKSKGFEVFTAYNGSECFSSLSENKVDLILLDIMLPDMSGWDVFEKIRKNPRYDHIRIAFLSAIPVSDERLKILHNYGVSDYITKPFDNGDLVQRVGNILSA